MIPLCENNDFRNVPIHQPAVAIWCGRDRGHGNGINIFGELHARFNQLEWFNAHMDVLRPNAKWWYFLITKITVNLIDYESLQLTRLIWSVGRWVGGSVDEMQNTVIDVSKDGAYKSEEMRRRREREARGKRSKWFFFFVTYANNGDESIKMQWRRARVPHKTSSLPNTIGDGSCLGAHSG